MTCSYMENIQGISKKLIGDGFRVETIVFDPRLPEKLADYSVKLARGIYQAIKIVPGELVEFEGENLNGPGIWVSKNQCHVVFSRPNVEDPYFKNKLGIEFLFDAIKIRGDSEETERQFWHFSPSTPELKKDFPEIYNPKE
ncbi:hypothetical protein HOD75_01450 [archaeon]|jgi:hypothetical protein|nr:hypothetical protein [archaeon]MBT4241543.1 hypothetical protein [archaeon]MBT4417585.1 hypothetical protein [archaeon]